MPNSERIQAAMSDVTSLKSTPRLLVIAPFVLLAAFFTYWSTSLYGPGLSPDSAGYVHLARDIKSNGLSFLTENKAVTQPPIYPMAVAATSAMTGISVLDAAAWINILCASTLVVIILLSVSVVTTSLPVLVIIGALSCFSVPLTVVWSMAWTEPLFIVVVSLTLFLVGSSKCFTGTACMAGLLTAVACYTRYAGVVLFPVVAMLIFFARSGSLWRRCRNVLFYALSGLILFAPYVARNYTVSGTLLGERNPSAVGMFENVVLAKHILLSWFVPPILLSYDVFQIGAFGIVAAAAWYHRGHVARIVRNAPKVVFSFGTFGIVYMAFIIVTSTSTAYDHINTRLLSPLYPSLLIILALLLKPESWCRPRLRQLALGGCCVLCAASVIVTHSKVSKNATQGAGGYNSVAWKESELIRHVQQLGIPGETQIFSNMPDVLYLLADVTAKMSPAKRHHNSNQTKGLTKDNIFDVLPELDGATLVWFDPNWRSFLFTLEELGEICLLTETKSFPDGKIFVVNRPHAAILHNP